MGARIWQQFVAILPPIVHVCVRGERLVCGESVMTQFHVKAKWKNRLQTKFEGNRRKLDVDNRWVPCTARHGRELRS